MSDWWYAIRFFAAFVLLVFVCIPGLVIAVALLLAALGVIR